ncbi:hypothetical protein ABW20_dc0101305 [Dactylellina cionopaga]|nr:hypothetical protein ABW20_dc0101305 [Dactylellina cionopaga]
MYSAYLFLFYALWLPLVLCDHRGYFILRIFPAAANPDNILTKSRYIVTAPSTPLAPISVRQQPLISPCPGKPLALYDPSSVWLADWRIPQPLNPVSSSFFNRALAAISNIPTPLLRSLSSRTRTLALGYLESDVDSNKEGRVTAVLVPDDVKSVSNVEDYAPDIAFVVVEGVAAIER